MTDPDAMKPVPGVSPHLVCRNAAAAIDFYTAAFGAVETTRLAGRDGRLLNAALRINGGLVLLVDEMPDMGSVSPQSLGGSPVTLHMFVPDATAAIARAEAAGATVVMPAQPMFWGDLYGVVSDPFGHNWSLATRQRPPMSSEELATALKEA